MAGLISVKRPCGNSVEDEVLIFSEIAMWLTNTSPTLFPSPEGLLLAITSWQDVVGKGLVLSASLPWEMLAAWQHTVGMAQREYADQWICRFGGGVPLDG